MERMRRLRSSAAMRRLVRETRLSADDLICPVFVAEGEGICDPVESMPGVFRYSIDRIPEMLAPILDAQIPAILIFGVPIHKDEVGSGAYDREGVTQRAIRRIKELAPELLVIADVCLCEYTSHGHCGLIRGGKILNDETLPLLAAASVTLAEAGADIIAPSDMMDGRVGYIREELDRNGFAEVPILSYSAKFASSYYAPFRDAAHSAPAFGDRKTYQMDPANGREAVRECLADLEEGADMLIIKPALPYLDVLKEVSSLVRVPIAVYQVSGEYTMIRAAALNGWIDEKRVVLETLTAMKRAGANMIITYYAPQAAAWIREGE
ncbi:MAG: porphobilinogen synthase [Mogibacterium sp.]|nr:porphobilinogen synthase [Mogibacterium sp.]